MKKEKTVSDTPAIGRILVPVDYSSNSIKAVQAAIDLARIFEAEILIAHVFHMPFADEHIPPEMVRELIDAQHEHADSELEKFRADHAKLFSTYSPIRYVTQMGFAAETILETAIKEQADLIILGTQGANSIEDRLFGTVTWNVIKHSQIPVMAIPENTSDHHFQNIMIPFEGTDKDNDTIVYLLGFAAKFNATVHAVHFLQDSSNYNKSMIDKLHVRFRKELDAERLQLHFLAEKNVTEGIRKFAGRNNIDLISMVTHHYGLFSTIFHMSVTRKIALYSEIPLLAYNIDK